MVRRHLATIGDENITRFNRVHAFETTSGPIGEHNSTSPYLGDSQHAAVKAGVDGAQGGIARGISTALGSSISVNEGVDGAESITLNHHTGAGVVIESDGSIFISSTSQKGAGIVANRGDVALAGMEIAINASGGITLKTNGAFIVDCADFMVKARSSYILQTGAMHEMVNGNSTREVGKDNSVMVGGIQRTTIAGDERHQVTGSYQMDVGKTSDWRAGDDTTWQSKAKMTTLSDEAMKVHTKDTLSVRSDAAMEVNTKATMEVVSDGNMTINTPAAMEVVSDGNMAIHSGAAIDIVGSSSFKASTGGAMSLDASGTNQLKSGSAALVSGSSTATLVGGSMAIVGGPTVDIAAGVLNAPEPTGTGGSASPTAPSPSSAQSSETSEAADAAAKPQVVEANTIVDEITSARRIPEYPRNAKWETEEFGSIGIVSYDADPADVEAYEQYSSHNKGTRYPVEQGSYGAIDDGSFSYGNYDQAPPVPPTGDDLVGQPPASDLNSNEKIDGSSLAEIVNAPYSHPIPNSKKEQILRAHAIVLQNVIAPLRAAGFHFMITSGYRNNSSNHKTGYAIDLQVPGRLLAKHYEIARYARDNLPVSQVFLERSGSGFTHVHLRAHPPGGSGAPSVLTCGDPRCRSRTSGLSMEYLRRRGVKGQ